MDVLRDEVRAGRIERVIVTAPDRLARNFVQQIVLLEEFKRHGCKLEFLDRPMSDDPNDQLLLHIRGAVADAARERTLISDRMRRGQLARYRAGNLLPWTRPPYGYRTDPDRPRDPDDVQIEEGEAAVWFVIITHQESQHPAHQATCVCRPHAKLHLIQRFGP